VTQKRLIVWSIIGTGVSSVSTQLLVIREFLSQFHGNEITISLTLFCWLALTALGSFAAKLPKRHSESCLSLLILAAALAPLPEILLIRMARAWFFPHGTSPGFYPIFFQILFTTTLYCFLLGFILPYALRVIQEEDPAFTSGDLYLADNIGDVWGGVLFSFILVYWFTPFQCLAISSSFLLLVDISLWVRKARYIALFATLPLVFMFYYGALNHGFETATLTPQYGKIVRYMESPYGRIVVSEEGLQHTFWQSGTPVLSALDVAQSEEKVHYPLCQLGRVENVLLVSGGLGETLKEIRKYHPHHVDYVELDPFLITAAREFGGLEGGQGVRIINTDARRFIRRSEKRYDAVILDLPDPDTFQTSRFYTSEFFSLVKGILSEGGVMSLSVTYGENYISSLRRKKLATIYRTVKTHFRHVLVIPGEEAYLICSDGNLHSDIPSRLRQKGIPTRFIEGFYQGNVTPDRVEQLERALEGQEPINSDFQPRLMGLVFREWFSKYGTSPLSFFLGFLAAVLIYLLFIRREEYTLFTTGLASMGVEMLVIFSFQIIYGYIYREIGVIVTAFLMGLLPGVMLGKKTKKSERRNLLFSDVGILVFLLLFLAWVALLKNELSPVFFILYGFLFSILCGYQFPVAARLLGEENSPAAGCLAADLAGAAVGTLVTGALLIPLFGIGSATMFLIFTKGSSFAFSLKGNRKTS
jgi:spermidine synthase